ncbi:MAG: GTP 3',8-cyclase MoaA [Phycisphaerae bacterium]
MTTRTELADGHGRRIRHMRLSVISTCDLRCSYCRPADLPQTSNTQASRTTELSDQQRLMLVAALVAQYGLEQVRITGGEPLLYRNVVSLVEGIRGIAPHLDLAMTTHGKLLDRKAAALRQAGLSRINISIDSLRADVYNQLTGGNLEDTLRGIDAASDAGFFPVKLNTVVLKGINDNELANIVTWAIERDHEVRFLEAMPIGPAAAFNQDHFVPVADMRRRLERDFSMEPIAAPVGSTARRFRVQANGKNGTIGFVSPVSEPFCGSCGRIRVTADGTLYPCLLDSRSANLQKCLDGEAWNLMTLDKTLRSAMGQKAAAGTIQSTSMVTIGG